MASKDETKAVEERIERRRELIAQRFEDVKLELSSKASRAVRSWPVVAVAGGLAAGYAISRVGRHPHAAAASPVQYVPAHVVQRGSPGKAKNVIAAIAGLAATALRIGASSEARMFYNAVKRYRDRRRYR